MTPTMENAMPIEQTAAKRSLLGNLFTLNAFITAPIVKIIYVVGLVLIPLVMIGSSAAMFLFALFNGAGAGFIMSGLMQLVVSVIGSILAILMLRIYCECVAVLFKVNEELQGVRQRLERL